MTVPKPTSLLRGAAALRQHTLPFLRSRYRFNWRHERANKVIDQHSVALQRFIFELDKYLEGPALQPALSRAGGQHLRRVLVDVVECWRDLCSPTLLARLAEEKERDGAPDEQTTIVAQLDRLIRRFDDQVAEMDRLLADLTAT